MHFTKMNGAGNDFILLDAIAEPFDESAAPALARALCDRRRSVGADGLMLVTRAEGDADYRMRYCSSVMRQPVTSPAVVSTRCTGPA